jgi:HAD superfamily hydrolase (TIGR01509 family)
MEDTCRILSEDSGLPRTVEEMMEAYTLWAADHPLPYPLLAEKDALPALEALKARGYLLGLASSTGRELVESALANAQLRRLLLCAVSSDDVTHKKPDPECYLLAARLMGVAPEACLAVEDTRVGLLAAKAAGMKVLCRVREYPQDFSGADGIVEKLSDLLSWAPPLQPRFQGNPAVTPQSHR